MTSPNVAKEDSAAYDGTVAMHQHLIECIKDNKQPLTDIRDAIHSMQLVTDIEGEN